MEVIANIARFHEVWYVHVFETWGKELLYTPLQDTTTGMVKAAIGDQSVRYFMEIPAAYMTVEVSPDMWYRQLPSSPEGGPGPHEHGDDFAS